MPIEIEYGDILEREADAIVVPEIAGASRQCELTAKIYEAAGFREMMSEYCKKLFKPRNEYVIENSGEIDYDELNELCAEASVHSTVTVTSGCKLNAKYAIHLDIREENWNSDQYDYDRYHKECLIYNCYGDALDCAKKLGAESVAIPLLGTCFLGFPEDYARLNAENAIGAWLCNNGDPMTVYLVIPFRLSVEDAFANADIFVEYEHRLSDGLQKSGLEKEEYYRKRVYEHLNKINGDSRMAELINYTASGISRFRAGRRKNGNGYCPHKHRVIALAVGIGLDDYERFELIRCSGYEYPVDNLDYQVEKIIRSGIKSFRGVNEELCGINPDYDLTAPVKKKIKNHSKEKSE